jgi:ribosome-associated protein
LSPEVRHHPDVEELAVRDGRILLGQLVKLAGLADTGGEARAMITGGDVAVNGDVETRRGRQLVEGDLVAIAGTTFVVTRL